MLGGAPTFTLFETLRLSSGVYALRGAHEARLQATAEWLRFPFDSDSAACALDAAAATAGPSGDWRVRLDLDTRGVFTATVAPLLKPFSEPKTWLRNTPLDGSDPIYRVLLLRRAVRRDDSRLYSKTSDRRCYDEPRTAAINSWASAAIGRSPTDIFDVLFSNEKDEITEFCVGNVVIQGDEASVLLTPPVAAGLLAGVLRNALIAGGNVVERVLTPHDIFSARAVWLVNGLRGWVRVVVEETPPL